MFSDGMDAVVVPYGALVWQLQTRVLFDWKRPWIQFLFKRSWR